MATPAVQKIGRGVTEIDRAKAQVKIPRLANLRQAPTNPLEIQQFPITGKARRDRLRAIKKEDDSFMERRTLEIHGEVKGLGLSATETRTAIDRGVLTARRERAEVTQEERVKIAAEAREDSAVLNSIKAPWHSAVAILNTSSLKSRDRADYSANMKDCNPLELDNYFTMAMAGPGDRDLAAACCGRYNTMNKAQKALVKTIPSEVAEVLVAEFFVVQEAFALADLYHEESKLVALEIDGKRTSPDQKIKIGTMLAAMARDFGIADPDNIVPKNETLEQTLDRKFPGGPDPEGFKTVFYGDPKRQAAHEAKKGEAAQLRKSDAVYWAAEGKEKGTGDAAVAAFKDAAGGGS